MSNTTPRIDNMQDIIDVRDIIERYEELEAEPDGLPDAEERCALAALLDDLKGNGGDEQWRGDWYPVTLIRESYFTDYARELCEDCGYIPKDFPHWIEVDWEATARNVLMDYFATEIDGVTYYYR